MSVTNTELRIMRVMKPFGACTGMGLVRAGFKKGTIYVVLQRMKEKGYIEDARIDVSTGRLMRYYQLTATGEQLLETLLKLEPVVTQALIS